MKRILLIIFSLVVMMFIAVSASCQETMRFTSDSAKIIPDINGGFAFFQKVNVEVTLRSDSSGKRVYFVDNDNKLINRFHLSTYYGDTLLSTIRLQIYHGVSDDSLHRTIALGYDRKSKHLMGVSLSDDKVMVIYYLTPYIRKKKINLEN